MWGEFVGWIFFEQGKKKAAGFENPAATRKKKRAQRKKGALRLGGLGLVVSLSLSLLYKGMLAHKG